MRVAVMLGTALSAVVAVGAVLVWRQDWVRDLVTADAVGSANAQVEASADSDPMVRLDLAIRRHDAEAVAQILEAGVDPNALDPDGETLLNKGVLFGTPEIVDVLLDAGADPDLPGRNGLGPLAIAALAGRHESLDRLMRESAVHTSTSPELAPPAPRERPSAATATTAAAVVGGSTSPSARAPAVPAPSPPADAGPTAAPAVAALPPAPSPDFQVPTAGASGDAGVDQPADTPTTWVVAVQRRLRDLGFYEGAADGVIGPQTTNAIVSYQAVAGVPQDGRITDDLISRIGAKVDPQWRMSSPLRPVSAPPARPSGADTRSNETTEAPGG